MDLVVLNDAPPLLRRRALRDGQCNLLVHDYLAIDDRRVFGSLSRLEDLRAFAAQVQRLLDAGS